LAAKPPSGAIAGRAEWSDPRGRRLESHAGTEGASTATSQKYGPFIVTTL
jgi:hypothetical protein